MMAVIVVGLTAFALLAARFVGVDPTSLWPLGEVGHEAHLLALAKVCEVKHG